MGGSRRIQSFEDLWIWKQARALVHDIYTDMDSGKSKNDFGFRDQIQRAGISVMNNIAEGFERGTNVEFARFLDIARGSAGEVRSMYYAAEDRDYVSKQTAIDRRDHCKQISAGLTKLISYLRKHQIETLKTRRVTESADPRVKELLVPYEPFGA